MFRFILTVFLAFFLILQTVEAISMGTVVKKEIVSIKADESARFTILFWNVENASYSVELELKEAPKNWFVVIQPKKFVLNSSIGEESIELPYMNKSVNALPVNIFVKPENAKVGVYNVIIAARAGSPQETLSFFQLRQFKLTVNITGMYSQKEDEIKTSGISKELKILTDKLVEYTSFNILYIIISVCILVVSFIIYKYA
jgi:uncharacterized membrane protein